MIIKKMAIPRRAMLRGLGAGLALPLLDAMVPALSVVARATTTPTRRLGFVYVPNGANMVTWTPPTTGANFTLSPTLTPLAPFQNQMVVATGLSNKEADSQGDGSGEHPRASAGWLTGVHAKRTEGADILAGTSADQIAAREIGKDSPLPSLEMGLESNYGVGNCNNGYACVYQGTVSWRTPTTPLSPEVNPRVIFERLFGEGGSTGRAAVPDAHRRQHPGLGDGGHRAPAQIARRERSAHASTSIWTRCARSSGASRRVKRKRPPRRCRRACSGRSACPRPTTSTRG